MSKIIKISVNSSDSVPLTLYREKQQQVMRLRSQLTERLKEIEELNSVIAELQDDIQQSNPDKIGNPNE